MINILICILAYCFLCLIWRGTIVIIAGITCDNPYFGFKVNLLRPMRYKLNKTPIYEVVEDDSMFTLYKDREGKLIKHALVIRKWQQELTESNWNIASLFFIPVPIYFNTWQYIQQEEIPLDINGVIVVAETLKSYSNLNVVEIYESQIKKLTEIRDREARERFLDDAALNNLSVNVEFKANKL